MKGIATCRKTLRGNNHEKGILAGEKESNIKIEGVMRCKTWK